MNATKKMPYFLSELLRGLTIKQKMFISFVQVQGFLRFLSNNLALTHDKIIVNNEK